MTFLIKIVIVKYHLSAFEITYSFCAPLVFVSYIGVKLTAPKSIDILDIPKDMFWPLMGRCITGFLTDVILFLAFTYTSYSKAFAVNKTESLFSPFIAYYTLGEAVRAVDILGIMLSFGGMLLMLQPWSS
jgi:drug/metabolite transporter (DMT)-like permease